MAKQILVPLSGDDRIEEVIPYVERVAQPGMKVVFLVRCQGESFGRMLPLLAKLEGGMTGSLAAARQMTNIYTWEGNLRRAKRKVSPICEVLERRGVETAVDVYTGSLRKAVRGYTLNGDVHGVLTRAGTTLRTKKFVYGALALFGLIREPRFSPVLSLHPHHQV